MHVATAPQANPRSRRPEVVTLEPILTADIATQAHLAAALLALGAVAGVIFLMKGTPAHVWTGRLFVAAMLVTAVTSFWITGINPGHYSWIHILSIITIVTIPMAIVAIRRGDRRGHAISMSINAISLVIAGLFTMLPPRIMHAVLFGP